MFYSILLFFMMSMGLTGTQDLVNDYEADNDKPELSLRDDGNGQSTGGGGR